MATRSGVRGHTQLIAAFTAMGEITTADRRAAREAGMKPVLEQAKLNLVANDSIVTGALNDSLGIANSETRPNRTEVGSRQGVFDRQRPSARAHLVEFPVAPHWQPRRFGGIMHPGHPGYPFLRPAYDEKEEQMVSIYFRTLYERIIARAAAFARGKR